jgi:hypothetical protein
VVALDLNTVPEKLQQSQAKQNKRSRKIGNFSITELVS